MNQLKLLLYCTKAKPYLTRNDLPNEKGEFYKHWQLGGELDKKHLYGDTPILNGKIVAECDFEVEEIKYRYDTSAYRYNNINDYYYTNTLNFTQLEKRSCLTNKDLLNYLGQNGGYAIHIKNLHIFDEPRDISNYYNIAPRTMADCMNQRALVKAPQNMCNAYDVYKNHYIVISIQSQYMCLILNRIKDVEVRKVVLKEMLK